MIDDILTEIENCSLKQVLAYTAIGNSTFSKADYPWLKYLVVKCVGGGGGSGGCALPVNAQSIHSAGGAGGALAITYVSALSITDPVTVTVGDGGAGGASGANAGSAGQSSSFGSYCIAGGGGGGGAGADGTSNHFNGGTGGYCTASDICLRGSDGFPGLNSGSMYVSPLGWGGASGGGHGGIQARSASNNSVAGIPYGGGAKGAYRVSSAAAGADGAQGLVILELYG